ncbi:MAG: Nif3-like dinuclear metal center hexameric protein [Oscillospiraceae bacterium]
MLTAGDIYDYLDEIMPFSKAEKWDNSGLLAGSADRPVTKVLTCLDITNAVVNEAAEKGAELVISHHPIIFDPIKSVLSDTPLYKLINNGITAICCHTSADIADCGTNGAAYELLRDVLGLGERAILEELFPDGTGLGWKCSCDRISSKELADKLGAAFKTTVRYTDCGNFIENIAFCSGSGGSLLDMMTDRSTALVTGDVKHNIFVDAENRGISVFDCTHYSTEILFAEKLCRLLSERFPDLEVSASEKGKDFISFSN